jgi:predicted DNA binding CopG/RHH family protein
MAHILLKFRAAKQLVIIWENELAKLKLSKEERELLDSYERGEWKSVKNLEQEIEKHRKYARQTLKKDKRINIRASSIDSRPSDQ